MQESAAGPQVPPMGRRFLERQKGKVEQSLRERGELAADERVVSGLPLVKVSPAIGLTAIAGVLPGVILTLIVQRTCYLLVTDRRVLVTGWSISGTKSDRLLSLDRPVRLALAENPKKSHFFGNKVRLPREIADFLGRDTARATLGLVAEHAFGEARAAPTRSSKASHS